MKKLLLILGAATILVACKHKTSDPALLTPNAMYNNNVLSDTAVVTQQALLNGGVVKKTTTTTTVTTITPAGSNVVITTPAPVTTSKSNGYPNAGYSNTSTATRATTRRKGWSGKAKGAVIGAGTGAILGAVVSKRHPGKGAVVGGITGAGLGYLIGANEDNKKKRGY